MGAADGAAVPPPPAVVVPRLVVKPRMKDRGTAAGTPAPGGVHVPAVPPVTTREKLPVKSAVGPWKGVAPQGGELWPMGRGGGGAAPGPTPAKHPAPEPAPPPFDAPHLVPQQQQDEGAATAPAITPTPSAAAAAAPPGYRHAPHCNGSCGVPPRPALQRLMRGTATPRTATAHAGYRHAPHCNGSCGGRC
eukprot:gene46155-44607_t